MNTSGMKIVLLLVAGSVVLTGCFRRQVNRTPPANMLLHPGPGVGGPGPGVMMGDAPAPYPMRTSQLAFTGPSGMWMNYDTSGQGSFDSEPLISPGRMNFRQGAIYRLKLTKVPGRPGMELYPTIEIGPTTPRTEAYLAHNAVPIQLKEEDFDQILSGNFVTKVIYLPDPEFQEMALAGVETLVSTRLDPGVDPIAEADRRGAILAILRIGNIDPELPGSDPGRMAHAGGNVIPAGFHSPVGGPQMPFHPAAAMMGGGPGPMPGPPMSLSPANVAGVTAPQYGMPITGTPIGLPGPPHIPLGSPAGLQKHVMRDWSQHHIPGPTEKVKINMRQHPGYSYPKPANRAYIVEKNHSAPGKLRQSLHNMFFFLK